LFHWTFDFFLVQQYTQTKLLFFVLHVSSSLSEYSILPSTFFTCGLQSQNNFLAFPFCKNCLCCGILVHTNHISLLVSNFYLNCCLIAYCHWLCCCHSLFAIVLLSLAQHLSIGLLAL
jgi:hypothetical protein